MTPYAEMKKHLEPMFFQLSDWPKMINFNTGKIHHKFFTIFTDQYGIFETKILKNLVENPEKSKIRPF